MDAAALTRLVKPYTKTGVARIEAMAAAVRQIDEQGIRGDIVECGVWRGGNIILARMLSPDRVCWLYDTFTGMTAPQDIDVHLKTGNKAAASYKKKMRRGDKWAGVSVDEVRANLAETGTLNEDKLRFVEGPVEETLLDNENLPEKIALLRLDTDWYQSTKIELEMLHPRLVTGGILIIDDYGHWAGARKAVDEYFKKPLMEWIDYSAVRMVKV